ncbi:imidazole glycerol phosphate synthase subunit HisH [Anaerocolumna cellulosilytica]|uniref:Imidazole glycerol phosphate synthase subunit HisH n=1 Tax=Anaerocolumna cellulosilytica TaxID=433286 RepID=A0A6S6R2H6_9FIRM|nr:imidazole glycerol phosphate synthase subunit HisH [Anaerocolumna cellulosilytica]BCJ95539.1 imidazole glycerol phosphate synthase subunit HisH [Anaerocolumna cellulosilytica]
MIAIIDYDAGNLRSVEKALHHLGQDTIITRNREELLNADKIILPGVGAFGVAMDKLNHYNLVETIQEAAESGIPFLGICLGLQLMFESSEESKGVKGLGLLQGKIVRIPDCEGLKIPHIGWNSLTINPKAKLFQGIDNNAYVYFVHSFYLEASNKEEVAATTHYSTLIDASAEKGNVFGCQFHPEKSGEVGLKILQNFAEL